MKVILHSKVKAFTLVDRADIDLASERKWYLHPHGYAFRTQYLGGGRDNRINKRLALHRLVLERKLGRELVPGEDTDHINRNRLDNRRSNLRVATRSQNNANSKGRKRKAPYKGVFELSSSIYTNRPFIAYTRVEGKQIRMGHYATAEEAAYVYDQWAMQLFGEFAKTNFEYAAQQNARLLSHAR